MDLDTLASLSLANVMEPEKAKQARGRTEELAKLHGEPVISDFYLGAKPPCPERKRSGHRGPAS